MSWHRALAAALVALGACRGDAPADVPQRPDDDLAALTPHGPAQLTAYLQTVVGADRATRARAVASWKLDPAAFARTVVPAYGGAYAEYAAEFDRLAPGLVEQLGGSGEVRARRHFADDPAATSNQIRLRWALPVLYPSSVATIGGAALDTAFVPIGERWGALLGLADVPLHRAAAWDPTCAARLARVGTPEPCTDVAWVVADAAMHADREAFHRACELAAARCR